jgi:hypothetical protein
MTDLQTLDCAQPSLVTLERVNFFPRMLLGVVDMVTDQDYVRQKLRRHNRFLHGWGVVCGLEVTPASTPPGMSASNWYVKIDSGYALGPYGDEIFVGEAVFLDLATCGPGASTDPCEPCMPQTGGAGAGVSSAIYVAIKYAECLARPVRAMPAGCACEQVACEYSRIRDSFQIECLTDLPPSPPPPPLCDYVNGPKVMPCPSCPTEPWVVLASVKLPASTGANINVGGIDNFVRRQIYSTAVLQEPVIDCCCGATPPPPPRPLAAKVTNIVPPNGSQFNTDRDFGPNPPGSIVITFDKKLMSTTVNNDTIQVASVVLPNGPPQRMQGNVQYSDGPPSTAIFTPTEPSTFDGATSGIDYSVTVRGTGSSPILDVDNLPLDGDSDGNPGGDFSSHFIVSTPIG